MTRAVAALACATTLLLASLARADASPDPGPACEEAYVHAQSLRRDGHLLAAREALLVCAHDPCSPELKVDCERWAIENETRLPSIVITAGTGGADTSEGEVFVDESAVGRPLDGKAIDLDPGPHRIGLVTKGASLRETVVLTEGSKLRVVRFDLTPLAARTVPTPAPRGPVRAPWPALVVTGVAVAAAASAIGFGIKGLSQRGDACPDGSCTTQAAYDSVKGWYTATDVALGVTAAAAATAVVLWVTQRRGSAPTSGLVVTPAGVRGTF